MVRRDGLIGIILVAALAIAAVVYWKNRQIAAAEMDTGLLSSRVVSAVFAAKSELKVATLTGEVVAVAKGCSFNCWVPNGQKTRAPYAVEYSIQLKGLPASAFRWNAKDRIMSVDIPDVTISRPNIDMSRARTEQSGAWVSRASGIAMQKQAAGYLATSAAAKAETPEYREQARQAARVAVGRFLEAPLAAAGLPRTRVVVRLPGDDTPAGVSREQWDLSRSIKEVLAGER